MAPKVANNTPRGKKIRSGILVTDKVKIIRDLENGISVQEIMLKYHIRSRSTVYCIQRSKGKIMDSVANIHGNIGKFCLYLFII